MIRFVNFIRMKCMSNFSVVMIKLVKKMVDDSTRIYVRFMGTKYKIDLVDPDIMSIIVLINEVMSRACNRHIKSDEKYELTITQA